MSKGALGLLSAYWPERTARHAHIPLERVTQFCVHRAAGAEGDRAALVTPSRTVTFAEMSALVSAAAGVVQAGVPEGGRVAVMADDPVSLIAGALGAMEADRLAFLAAGPVERAVLDAFEPGLVIGPDDAYAPPGAARLSPAALAEGSAPTLPRPNFRLPILAQPRPWPGEVLHNHKTLVATAISFGSFFMLEPGAELVVFEPPTSWLGLSTLLGSWHKAATVRAAWGPDWAGHPDRVDYLVADFEAAEARYAGAAPTLRDVHAGIGAILGISGPFSVSRRRRLARRLRAPVFTLVGRNDLGPYIGSHPTWALDDAAGIPMPNVDLKPLNPADGSELTIGWDAIEEGEIGVKSVCAPAGGELTATWLRTRMTGFVDPTGLYFLRQQGPLPGADPA
ncbi:MAG TPA: hypothetical protein VI854_07080 [Acidimicrobiia bacterium]|nr:hypothetical protein [Acidimicrobiia bacterium]